MAVTRRAEVVALKSSKYDPPGKLLAAYRCSRCRVRSSSFSFSCWSLLICKFMSSSWGMNCFLSSSRAISWVCCLTSGICMRLWMGFLVTPKYRLEVWAANPPGNTGSCCWCWRTWTGVFCKPPVFPASESPAEPAAWGSLIGNLHQPNTYTRLYKHTFLLANS